MTMKSDQVRWLERRCVDAYMETRGEPDATGCVDANGYMEGYLEALNNVTAWCDAIPEDLQALEHPLGFLGGWSREHAGVAAYYRRNGVECIQLSRWYDADWGQCIQYVFRHKGKNGVEDLRKALWFARDGRRYGTLTPHLADVCELRLLHWRYEALAADSTGMERVFWKAVDTRRPDSAITAIERMIDEWESPDGRTRTGTSEEE